METCLWLYESDSDYYDTACGEAFTFTNERLEDSRFKFCPYCGKPITQQQLAAMTTERDNYKRAADENGDRWLASQARVGELEAEKQSSDFLRKRAFEELQKQVATSRQLQATLAARERVIEQQEATIRGYRHSVEIMGRNHDDRKAERDAARQDAARLRAFAEYIKVKRREQWHRWADEAEDPMPTDDEIERLDEQYRMAHRALKGE